MANAERESGSKTCTFDWLHQNRQRGQIISGRRGVHRCVAPSKKKVSKCSSKFGVYSRIWPIIAKTSSLHPFTCQPLLYIMPRGGNHNATGKNQFAAVGSLRHLCVKSGLRADERVQLRRTILSFVKRFNVITAKAIRTIERLANYF